MNVVEITVQRRSGNGWPIVVEWHQSGVFLPVRSEDVLCLSEEHLVELTAVACDPLAYGTLLGQALFTGQVLRAFDQARAASAGRFRVLLSVEASDLKTLHWERLCAPLEDQAWDFLALDQRVPFSLYLPSSTDRRFRAIGRRDLRTLLLVANPEGLAAYGLADFDAAGTVLSIRRALGDIPCDVLAAVEGAAGPPTLDALCRHITAGQYTLLHVVAHGRVMEGETILYLAGDGGQVAPVTGTDLIQRLRRLEGAWGLPHFFFLSTCESASPEAEAGLGGLAQRLVKGLGVPAVLAMTEMVTIDTAEALSAYFYQHLRKHGEPDRALVEACAGLVGRPDVTVPALYSRLGGRPLFSDAGDRELTGTEIAFGLDELERLLPERAPVREDAFAAQAGRLRGMLGADRAELSQAARGEWDEALAEVNALCEEVLDLNFRALALGRSPPAYDARCPFLGLLAFSVDDRDFFFGRGPLVQQLQARLADGSFLAVLGPSGSGKSSLVLAGLVPALREGDAGLCMAYLTPGSDPEAQLEKALATLDKSQRGLPDSCSTVLVVDQFEELFTLCTDEEKRKAFLERLLPLADEVQVVLTMRADFWGECAPYRTLKKAMQAHQELIAPMDASELRRAMEMQAAAVGLRFESDLTSTILDEVQGEPGAMPLLQHALRELWKRRHGCWLQAREYRAIGGVRRAIAETADQVYGDASPEEQVRLRDIFLRLTRLAEEPVHGEERRDTRRRVGLTDLVPAGANPVVTKALVHRLANARLVVTSVNAVTGAEEVEVAHEALIRYWPRLQGWLVEDRDSLRLRAAMSEGAQEWWDHKEDESYLVHRGARLEEAEMLFRQGRLVLNQLEQRYLNACLVLREREKREVEERRQQKVEAAQKLAEEQRLRAEESEARRAAEETRARVAEAAAEAQRKSSARLLRLVTGLVLVLIIALIAAWLAIRQGQIAKARSLIAQSQLQVRNQDLNLATLLALEAQEYEPSEAERILGDEIPVNFNTSAASDVLLGSYWFSVLSVAWSPDGRTLASGLFDGTISLWDVERGEVVQTLQDSRSLVESVAWSPDGRTLASGFFDGTIKLWDVERGEIIRTLQGHGAGIINSVAWSPDGRTLASGSSDATIKLWDVERGEVVQTLQGHGADVNSVTWSPDGRTLASGSADGTIKLWDVKQGEVVRTLLGHGAWVSSVVWSPDGHTLASGFFDGTIKLWDAERGEVVRTLLGHGHEYRVETMAWSPDGRTLASGSFDRTIRLWDAERGEVVQILLGHGGWVLSVGWSPDGRTLASGSSDDTIKVWDVERGEAVQTLQGHSGTVNSVAWSPDGRTLASGCDDAIELWDVELGEVVQTLQSHRANVNSVAWSPDGRTLASGSDDATIKLWDVERGEVFQTLQSHGADVNSVAWSPDGRTLASGSSDDTIKLWDVEQGEVVQTLQGHEWWVSSVAWSPNGRSLASGSDDNTIKVWDVEQGEVLQTLRGHGAWISSVAWSPDGRTLASGSDDGTIKLWDVERGQVLQTLQRHGADYINSVAWSPDGHTLASGSGDRTIKLWPEFFTRHPCAWVTANLTPAQWLQFMGWSIYRPTCPGRASNPAPSIRDAFDYNLEYLLITWPGRFVIVAVGLIGLVTVGLLLRKILRRSEAVASQ